MMQLERFLERAAERRPGKTALVCGGRRLTYLELEQQANRLAHGLIRAGVRRGDRVAIHLENSIEAVTAVFAVLKAGAVFLLVNPTTKLSKLAYILNDSRAVLLAAPARKLDALRPLADGAPHLQCVALAGDRPDAELPGKRTQSFAALMAGQPATPPTKRTIDIDLAALIYTSGSTGGPKGVMMTHQAMVSAATSINTYLDNTADDVILSVLPLSFDYGLYQVLMSCQVGATIVLERSFSYPHAVLEQVAAEQVTGLPLVPTMLAMMLRMDLDKYDFSSLRYVTNTGAALPVEHIRQLRRRLPHVALFSMYGLTECKRVAYLPPEQIDVRPASVGKAMPNTEAYLVDEQGRRLGPGQIGELVVRGANVMRGYWERPEETARVLRPGPIPGERVLHTGDLFRMDEEGYLYFLGRKDDIIKSRGEKVSPREVEEVLCLHPAVAEAAVFGRPDPLLGQAVAAAVVLRPGCCAAERDLLRHCAEHLEDFMRPREIRMLSRLPKTANGKVDKRALARPAAAAPAAGGEPQQATTGAPA